MVSNYARGRRFEYRVKSELEGRGWVVIRAARSRPFDLVALKGGRVVLIECKRRGYAAAEQRRVQMELAERAGAEYVVVTPENLRQVLDRLEGGGGG